MQTFMSPLLLFAMFVGVLALVSIGFAFRTRPTKSSIAATTVATLPAVLFLVLFYSLAIHMPHSLGDWPTSIGERGFSPPLITHAHIATTYFGILSLVCIFAWPVAFGICLLVRRWRARLYYLGLYAFACLISFGAMLLAPSQFLNWWGD